jgi:hypothetical protein
MRIPRPRFGSMMVIDVMRAVCRTAVLVLLLAVGLAPVLGAEPILISDGRYVQAFAAVELPERPSDFTDLRRPDVPFGPFDATAVATRAAGGSTARSTASQRSMLSPSHMTAIVVAESIADANGIWVGTAASSAFSITFDLPIAHSYEFRGDFVRSGDGFTEFESAFAGEGSLGEGQELSTHGVLGSGRHQLFVSVLTEAFPGEQGSDRPSGTFSVDLSLHPVPEPATIALIGGALSALAVRQRRRFARGPQQRSGG